MDKPIRKPNDEKGMLGNGKEKKFCSSHTAELMTLPLSWFAFTTIEGLLWRIFSSGSKFSHEGEQIADISF